MAARGWWPVAAIAAARPGGGGPGRGSGSGPASEPAPGPVPEPAAPATAALYVHWPYCRKRCSYCNFNKYVVPAVDEAAVRACLVRETRTLLRLSQVQSITSVFFGGGTPSLASPRTIAAVLEAVAGAAHLPDGAEVTLEANPSSAGTPRLAGFRAAGVNRLSIGVQLTLERGTVLAAQVWGGALPTPPQDLLADMYQAACATLVATGFRHYEVSNFARKGALSTHNLSYWRAEQYIGVGPGAHGRFVPWGEGGHSREARVQTLEPDAWMREVRSRGHGTRRRMVLSPLEQLEEVLALGLRTDEGVTQERWGRFSPHLSLEAVFGAPGEAKDLQQQGWLVLDGSGLRCTGEGLGLLDSLLPDLLCQLQHRWALPAAPAHPAQGPAPGCGSGAPRRSPTGDRAGGEAAGLTGVVSGGSGE
ncbi:radical S-adenosyl methionine domain-containing protein 1, mitochondrial isoform X2 [Balearica regulorum gibbericeps]|uniref:radical S-adenosyl methionine domain-containing protein 1, mitochondrial isoform X2 n=1 Tax=Balearica regulorum gibbericeps TaxID=100784 RepID=UPI003F63BC86